MISPVPGGPVPTPPPSMPSPERRTRPLYVGRLKLLNWADTAKSGRTAQLALLDISLEDIHPFKGIHAGNEFGQRLKIALTESTFDLALSYDPQEIWTGESLLLRWSDDSYAGAQISVRLDSYAAAGNEQTVHPLHGRRAGKKEGDEIYGVIWGLSDDDAVMQLPARKPRRPFNTLTATQQSQILSRDATFQHWLITHLEEFLDADLVNDILSVTMTDDELVANAVRRICGVESRAELSQISPTSLAAQRRWRALLENYEDYRRGRPEAGGGHANF